MYEGRGEGYLDDPWFVVAPSGAATFLDSGIWLVNAGGIWWAAIFPHPGPSMNCSRSLSAPWPVSWVRCLGCHARRARHVDLSTHGAPVRNSA